uniref:Uncharacterized protein n=1 Tax=Pyxicephalus adspersus TaxID=30357 RepID=A0AAV2ZV58_PYXAD|nr:TPA: hypothetical protein GDO54_016750 [Pyxicephalus adspersus]
MYKCFHPTSTPFSHFIFEFISWMNHVQNLIVFSNCIQSICKIWMNLFSPKSNSKNIFHKYSLSWFTFLINIFSLFPFTFILSH